MPATGVPAPQDQHEATESQHSGGDQRGPGHYLN